jgi:hypothetical protein
LLIAVAPSVAARFTAVPRFTNDAVVASTSRILQFGQTAETMSMSSEISCDQLAFAAGRLVVLPVWLTFLKQPLAVVQAGRP